MRRLLLGLALVMLACEPEENPGIAPLPPTSGARRAPAAEEPSPFIVAPHLRRTEGGHGTARADTRALGGGGAGGGASGRPTLRPPTQREVDSFRRRFDPEIEENVDPSDDPCDQFGDVMRATVEASDPRANPSMPSRAELRQTCRRFPAAYRQCLSPEYFREHVEECNREMENMAERGERMVERARRREREANNAGEGRGRQGSDRLAEPEGG